MVIETISRQLMFVFGWFKKNNRKIPEHLYLQLDNASDNKSSLVFAYVAALVHFEVFMTVTIMFLLRGHTHNICDQKFSVIERRLRLTDVKPLSWTRLKWACEQAWHKVTFRPTDVSLVTSNANFESFLRDHIDPHFARYAMDGNSGEDVHVFHFAIPDGKAVPHLYYQYRAGPDEPWFPRPYNRGDIYPGNGMKVVDADNRNLINRDDSQRRSQPTDGEWILRFNDNEEDDVRLKSPGIPMLRSLPVRDTLTIAKDDPKWKGPFVIGSCLFFCVYVVSEVAL